MCEYNWKSIETDDTFLLVLTRNKFIVAHRTETFLANLAIEEIGQFDTDLQIVYRIGRILGR